ncbi:uncharacterized protein K452DRAFT_357863 [Aplosporella prunicola CBS 121167]|uniref:Uncharacterized protein n=1 Tax=Aplosporella prunicola CBS 121167 TaxID=1176127 RepID=A0A6A6BH55_9PEZI|nr:uncharacterized protein K452DRAFT_357863 [Aplosporella prunicola CBS 121167]KAF2142773.1 hypothetical protein K452DRAFT_357863 [Aplosporella prunicola CBS 121167]
MTIDWKSLESYQRLLGAMVAASDNNVDYKKVAYFYGQGATYDSIEGRFRIAKKQANVLKKEAEDENRVMPASRAKSTTSTPRKPKAKPTLDTANGGVISGRVTKSPSKKKAAAPKKVKQEPHTPTSMSDAYGDDEGGYTNYNASTDPASAEGADFTTSFSFPDVGNWVHENGTV